jgi:hypothetical protein
MLVGTTYRTLIISLVHGNVCGRFGLAKAPAEDQVLDLPSGNFNTALIRFNCLLGELR